MENLVSWLVTDYFSGLLDTFVDPKKRVSIVYLASAIILALAWSFFVNKKIKIRLFVKLYDNYFQKKFGFLHLFARTY